MKTLMFAVLISMVGLLSGCQMLDTLLAEQAADSADLAISESGLILGSIDEYGQDISPEQAAQIAAENAGKRYQSNCAVAEADGVKVTYHLTNCTGRYGLVYVTGTLEAVFSESPGGIKASISGSGLKVNQADLDLEAEAVLTIVGSERKLEVSSHSVGTGPRGHQMTRTGEYVVVFSSDTECIRLDGTWSTKLDDKQWESEIANFERCQDGCPSEGGQIEFKGPAVTITLVYDGGDAVSWTSTRGNQGIINLFCSP